METRANHLWVGIVTLLLIAALALFIVWLTRLGGGEKAPYDIFFKQSVSGLASGSQVSFAGVPVGQVAEIKLWDKDPEFVRVRIRVDEGTPILVGTTATISASFTGVSTINLDGARRGAAPITCETTACPEGVPVITPGRGGFGEIVANAPLLLERLATLTERMSTLLSDENQAQISGILANTNELTGSLANTAPQIEGTLAELQVTLREASESLDAFESVMGSTDQLINSEGQSLAAELRKTLGTANKAANSLSETLDAAKPAAQRFNTETLPAAQATLEDLRATSKALRSVTEKVENEGATSLLGNPKLPDYEP